MSLQVIEPRIRGFISLTAHPEGCAVNVREQREVVRAAGITGRIGTDHLAHAANAKQRRARAPLRQPPDRQERQARLLRAPLLA